MTAYATAGQLKAYLGVSEAWDDALITDLLDRTSAAIDAYTSRTFAAAAATERAFDAVGRHIAGPTLYFDKDACAIQGVTNGDGTAVSASEYVTLPRNDTPFRGIQLKDAAATMWTYATDWEGAIKVNAKWAYSETPPLDVVQACIQWAAFMYRKKDSPLQDVTAIEQGVAITPISVPGDVKALLSHYRRFV